MMIMILNDDGSLFEVNTGIQDNNKNNSNTNKAQYVIITNS